MATQKLAYSDYLGLKFSIPSMIRYVLLLFLFVCSRHLDAQSLKAYQKAANKAMAASDYNAAAYYLQYILRKDPTNPEVMYMYADCARMMYAYPIAEQYYAKAAKSTKRPLPNLLLRQAQVYHGQSKYAEAVQSYKAFLSQKNNPDQELQATATALLASAEWAYAHRDDPQSVTINPLPKGINSAYSDFAPALQGDTLYYSSYRFKRKKDTQKPTRKLTKVMYSINGGRGREASRIFPDQDSMHIAHTSFSAFGKFLIYTGCFDTASLIHCDLYLSVRDDRGRYLPGVKLPEEINLKGATTTHPHLVYDSIQATHQLYFASDRAGGKGGLDLYRVSLDTSYFCECRSFAAKKTIQLPKFAKPVPLTSLNTPGNDASPFYHALTRTLWFSSDLLPGYGGYDIFSAELRSAEGDVYLSPINAGSTINSSYNDLYPIVDKSGRNGYLASNRLGSMYLDASNKACCNDLYRWSKPEPTLTPPNTPVDAKPPVDVVTIPPKQNIPGGGNPPNLQPPIKLLTPEQRTQAFVGLPLFFDNDEPDKRTKRPTTQKTYETTALAYLNRQEEYKSKFAEGAKTEDEKAEAIDAVERFFDLEVRSGYDRLFELTELILQRLEAGEKIEVFVKGFTSPRAKSDYNLQLGHRRVSSVKNHFEKWNEGILQAYISRNQLIITEASFGETTASTKISDRIEDERNSIYHPDAARERRVEIIEIKTR